MQKSTQHGILITAVLAGMIAAGNAWAGTATATMTNTVTIGNDCIISTTGFTTTYDPVVVNATTNQDVTASVTTTCTPGATPVITLGQGANANTGSTDSVPLRRLSSGGGSPTYLNYALFSDSGRTTTWGNTAGTAPASITATGTATPLTVYARVPSGQSGLATTFTDTVVATVTF
ncbi:Csu type fimbrial protein [Collimonas humicola]|uniref:Csu type fimbrial protein n=1 Tax=Collimonas humicola TaxID=2825886 RepID=UPI001B8BECBF|nr:spore coat protein U domain-containing protein [Collimonas humicola]